ncbi:MAG: 4-(cytidine 5'-diphospho)-2-C-methyl-D-erythritol kinase [Chloracidobacterium sp.]|nr:4-(cytidine 5'-diphospho)-2-C-methyl-D-erythritol kinase [Chloracidobacterium sp.]MDW8218147.1 4-(cytidine 5'-diphospho)-2-C-methyl-D-erythritol kinase [Acidobacteriota bacterium]
MPTVFPAFAKINLSLEVIGRRPDGYHELRTVFQTIDLHDRLEIEATATPGIHLTCDDPTLVCDERNLVVRAAQALQAAGQTRQGARIHLQKRIPMQAGLGGGSSDAAVTLLALRQLWAVNVSDAELHHIATQLGADVPFFLVGGTALGLGRGDLIHPLPDAELPSIVLIHPNVSVPTGPVFRRLNAGLTTAAAVRTLAASSQADVDWRQAGNDLEAVVFEDFSVVREARDRLRAWGASVARMSGSGGVVFGLFADAATSEAARQAGTNAGWRCWVCRAVGREAYTQRLLGSKM